MPCSSSCSCHPARRQTAGLLLIALGLFFLATNFGWFRFHLEWRQWWPLWLIFWGVFLLILRGVGARRAGVTHASR